MARSSISFAADEWVGSLRKSRNALSPIGRVPVELMAEILLSSLRVKDRSCIKRLQQLASVTTRWWAIILSFPRFWTTINSKDNVALKLRRSRNMPLTIALHRESTNRKDISTIGMVKEHLKRCRNLQLSGNAVYHLNHTETVELPLLEKLDCSGDDPEVPIPFYLPPINVVHSVRFRSAIMDWSKLVGLRTLHISKINIPSFRPSAAQLADILRSSPLLEVLELEDLMGGHNTDAPALEGEKITQAIQLPKLRKLILRYIWPEGTAPFLRRIQAKSLLDFRLLEFEGVILGICEKECQSLVRTVIKNGSIDRIIVWVTPTYVEMRGVGSEARQVKLRLYYHAHSCLPTFQGLKKSIPKNICIDLRISIPFTSVPRAWPGLYEWRMTDSILDHLHGIESLSLKMHPDMINGVAEKLSKSHHPSGQAALGVRWPAQRLSRLRVTTSAKIDLDFTVIEAGLVALLKIRAQAIEVMLPELVVSNDAGFILTMVDGRVEWTRRSPS